MNTINLVFSTHGPESETMSGGAVRELEIMKRMSNYENVVLYVISSKTICQRFQKNGIKAYYRIVPCFIKDKRYFGLLIDSILRSFYACFLSIPLKNNDVVIYSPSDFLWDTIPAFIWKLRNKNRKYKWAQAIFHIISPPIQRGGLFITNLASFSGQRSSFQLIKWNADLVFVLNNMAISQLTKLGFSKNRIYVTGAGINLSQIDEIQRVEGVNYDACFLGRLHPSKGIFDLIDIWKLVVSKIKSARLAIIYVGSKDLESALTKRIEQENLISNIFMLPLTGKNALKLVKTSKVFAFPSHEEGWGIAISEAMACGLPVVAYDLPVYKEIFTQGIVTVPIKDFKSFSNEIINLLENSEKRNFLAEKGRIQVKLYDWDSVALRELSFIKKELS